MFNVVRDDRAAFREGGRGDERVHVADGGSGRLERDAKVRIAPGGFFAPRDDVDELEEEPDRVLDSSRAFLPRSEPEFRGRDRGDAQATGVALDALPQLFVSSSDDETARVRVEHEADGIHAKRFLSCGRWAAARSSAKSGQAWSRKKSVHVRRRAGDRISESPSRRTKTSEVPKRNGFGMRTACDRPVMKTFAVVMVFSPLAF